MKECDRIQWREDHSNSTLVHSRYFKDSQPDHLEKLLGKEVKDVNNAEQEAEGRLWDEQEGAWIGGSVEEEVRAGVITAEGNKSDTLWVQEEN